jgi:LysR family glycine cleavage system transcriptional activator
MSNLPPLNSLTAFEVTARNGNISKAAEELFLTHSAVSRRISRLEEYMGASLFERMPRGVELTYHGRQLFAVVSDLIATLAIEVDKVRVKPESNMNLKVSLLPSFAARWLVPRLIDFDNQFPNIDLELSTSLKLVDFEKDGVDMAIRYGQGSWPGLESVPFIEQTLYPVIGTRFQEKFSHVTRPEHLAQEKLLHDCSTQDWQTWLEQAGVSDFDCGSNVYDDYNIVLESTLNGLGVALGRCPIVDFDLKAGRLKPLFDTGASIPGSNNYFIVYPAQKERNPALPVFRDWLLGQVGGN